MWSWLGHLRAAVSEPQPTYPALSTRWRLLLLAGVVAQFLFVHGAVWKQRFDWDHSILYSYLTIPPLVLVALLLTRRFGPVAWLVHTIELMAAKFAVTASVLLVLLVFTDPPEPAPPAAASAKPASRVEREAPAPPSPSVIDERDTGELEGQVLDAKGQPVSGALVYVARGLERFTFAPGAPALVLENDGRGLSPARVAVHLGQALHARATDRQLHTLLIKRHGTGAWITNVPVPEEGELSAIALREATGLFTIECAVHGKKEAPAYLGRFAHPFFTWSDAEGRFRLTRVPHGALEVEAFLPPGAPARTSVTVQPRQQTTMRLSL